MSEPDEPEEPGSGAVTRRGVIGGGAAGLAAALLAACGSSQAVGTTVTATAPAAPVFGNLPPLRFTVINHFKRSAEFAPTRYGVDDACQLLGCSYEWTGSTGGVVAEMVDAINNAIIAKVDGIATTIVDREAFAAPIASALRAGIPVIAYNAGSGRGDRLAYVGGDARSGGRELGARIASLVPAGSRIAVFVSDPGLSNLQERLAGLREGLRGSTLALRVVASGAGAGEQSTVISQYLTAHPALDGLFGLDAGSTEAVGSAIQAANLSPKDVIAGGYGLTPTTPELIASGALSFAIDEQLYLQGFLPVLELYLHRASASLTGPVDVDTGVRFVDRHLATRYQDTQSRFEGTSSTPGLQGG